MKKGFLILLLVVFSFSAKADHITGGEMSYAYQGFSSGLYHYAVSLKLYMRCNSGRMFPDPAVISVFNKGTFARIEDISVPIGGRNTIQITSFDPCITNPPTVCYEVAIYDFFVSVPAAAAGYILSCQVNYRIRGMSNVQASQQVGATYTCEIPGTTPPPDADAQANTSAYFTGSDLVIVCAGNFFSYSFAAEDNDNHNLRYSFCPAYSTTNSGANGVPSGSPPFSSIPYATGFSETSPLGIDVSINPTTGLITGIAPDAGMYVVTVCVEEIRNGIVLAVQRKDIQINVADCNIAAAVLEKDYMLCGNTRSITITNKSNSPLIVSQDWEVLSPAGATLFTTSDHNLNYTFANNGTYTVRLIINKGKQCGDTTSTLVYVYPGLVPDFESSGICITKPINFTDRTTLLSGSVNSWKWELGEPTTGLDVSTVQHPTYSYPFTGPKDVRLIVTTTDGCRDTINKIITIIDKPPITLAFRDTLICVNDLLPLRASGTGNFTWSPLINMVNPNSASPTVSPPTTTKYYVDLETDGCMNRDSVLVRVVDHVSLQVMNDTTICRGDTIQLRIVSDGLRYSWLPASQVLTPGLANPFVVTTASTNYQVTAVIGGCNVNRSIRVHTVPYPLVQAGPDTVICYQTTAQLHGSTDGNSWQWSPASTLNDAAILNPLASPATSINNYILTAYDTRGCPKPGRDTVLVTMLPKIIPFAGRDTVVVINQPLQLTASGGDRYVWSPAVSLSSPVIANPVAIFHEPSDGLRYKVKVFNSAGCSDSAYITIKVFSTMPTVFVPTGFTPNNDGKNDILRPTAVGMKKIEYFSVFNRWGQLVFRSANDSYGWDGKIGGQLQGTNTYIWMVSAIDFMGKPYFQRGTVTLIR